ncbi:hypothetical protein A3Q56_05972 [Intoshia linei]|uniref:Caspase-3 n=1 Tax=Intoshia linei TaxID=1819745 RepID=A0A177AWB3_9BILA|nr:hypothetical protein A3Q56_05972 [Intoshia linei]
MRNGFKLDSNEKNFDESDKIYTKYFHKEQIKIEKLENMKRDIKKQFTHKQIDPINGSSSDILPHYTMTNHSRGVAIIINNQFFEKHLDLSERSGTQIDQENLITIFEKLNFSIIVKNNYQCQNTIDCLKKVSKMDHSNNDCFILVILSHGINGYIYGSDGMMDVNALIQFYNGKNCQTLIGKPKLFFIQACRGDKFDEGVECIDGPEKPFKLPRMSDMLIYYSVVPGFYSWRNSMKGSWFVQAINKAMANYGKCEIMQILTMANYYVAREFESKSRDPFMSGKKQIPCIMSMLTKQLYFEKNYLDECDKKNTESNEESQMLNTTTCQIF